MKGKRLVSVGLSIAVAAAGTAFGCGGDTAARSGSPGDEGQACFPNETCNAGLSCLSHLCVSAPDGGGTDGAATGSDGSTEGATGAEAGPDGGSDAGDAGVQFLSCVGLAATCGPADAGDCCASPLIPGGMFDRSYDGYAPGQYNDSEWHASISTFRLDKYEISVGRFRVFVAGYPGNKPAAGSGRDPNYHTDGGILDPGWDSSWNASLPSGQADLVTALKCVDPTLQTWTDTPGANENKAINCLSYYTAFAFCIWDGGRLPTETEWNYAAAGGSEQRFFPWSNPPSSQTIDSTYAVFSPSTPMNPVATVGSRSPLGDGKWGQSDLGGNVTEWTRDAFSSPYALQPCDDCLSPGGAGDPTAARAIRGGGIEDTSNALRASIRFGIPPTSAGNGLGGRCARD